MNKTKMKEAEAFALEVNGVILHSPVKSNYPFCFYPFRNVNTADLPPNIRFSPFILPVSTDQANFSSVIMLENLGEKAKVFLLSSIRGCEFASDFICSHIFCAIKRDIIVEYQNWLPTIEMCLISPFDPESQLLLYSIQMEHNTIFEVLLNAAHFDKETNDSIDNLFDFSLNGLQNNLGVTNRSLNTDVKGSLHSIIIPTEENFHFIEITEDDIISRFELKL